ncbi:hypothetical protein PMAYCL1PPCAC_06253, partial [Pristionchus mayeri]
FFFLFLRFLFLLRVFLRLLALYRLGLLLECWIALGHFHHGRRLHDRGQPRALAALLSAPTLGSLSIGCSSLLLLVSRTEEEDEGERGEGDEGSEHTV